MSLVTLTVTYLLVVSTLAQNNESQPISNTETETSASQNNTETNGNQDTTEISGEQNNSEIYPDRNITNVNTLEKSENRYRNLYKYIVLVIHASKVYTLGIYFRPRFVIVPHTRLFYYEEFPVYVASWDNYDLRNESTFSRVVASERFRNRDACDFELSLLRLETPFEGGSQYWSAPFMEKERPPVNTKCMIVHFSLNSLHQVDSTVTAWDEGTCIRERGFMHKCQNDTFLCLSLEKMTEVDITASPVLCNKKIVGAVPGYYIHDVAVIQYLPHYSEWYYNISNDDMAGASTFSSKLVNIIILFTFAVIRCFNSCIYFEC